MVCHCSNSLSILCSIMSSTLLAQLGKHFCRARFRFSQTDIRTTPGHIAGIDQQFPCKPRVNLKYSSDGFIRRTLLLGFVYFITLTVVQQSKTSCLFLTTRCLNVTQGIHPIGNSNILGIDNMSFIILYYYVQLSINLWSLKCGSS